jgi:hypothetical protein
MCLCLKFSNIKPNPSHDSERGLVYFLGEAEMSNTAIGHIYSEQNGGHRLDYSMSDERVPQVSGWLQVSETERVPVTWVRGGHTWCYWKRD